MNADRPEFKNNDWLSDGNPSKIGNSFSLRDDSMDGGGRTKFGTRVEKARMRGIVNSWA
jgi:hypothetical protein